MVVHSADLGVFGEEHEGMRVSRFFFCGSTFD